MALMHALIFFNTFLYALIRVSLYCSAEVVGGLHWKSDWNDDRRSRGCRRNMKAVVPVVTKRQQNHF